MAAEIGYALDVVIKILLIIVLVLVSILIYRFDRIIASGRHSAEKLERTAENVERSSEAFLGLVSLLERLPLVGRKKGDGRDE